MHNRRKTRYDVKPLVELIKSSLKNNGGVDRLEHSTRLKEDTYYGRNRDPDKYQIGELRDIVIAFNISKVHFLYALVAAFEIPVEAINAVSILMQVERNEGIKDELYKK